jgi:hypothetical protein
MARSRLTNLKFEGVDLVDRGDNPEAHVLLVKRDPTVDEEPTKEEMEAYTRKAMEDFDNGTLEGVEGDGDAVGTVSQDTEGGLSGEKITTSMNLSEGDRQSIVSGVTNWFTQTFGMSNNAAAETTNFAGASLEKRTFDDLLQEDVMRGFFSEAYKAADLFAESVYCAESPDEINKSIDQLSAHLKSRFQQYRSNNDELAKIGRETDKDELVRTREVRKNADVTDQEDAEETSEATEVQEQNEDATEGGEVNEEQISAIVGMIEDEETQQKVRGELEKLRKNSPGEVDESAERSDFAKSLSDEDRAIWREFDPEDRRDIEKADAASRGFMFRHAKRSTLAQIETEEARFEKRVDRLESLPVESRVLGKVLRRVSKGTTTDDDVETIVGVLASADSMAELGGSIITRDIGVTGRDAATVPQGQGTAKEELRQKAVEISKRDNVSVEVGFARAGREHPEIRERYEAEEFGEEG